MCDLVRFADLLGMGGEGDLANRSLSSRLPELIRFDLGLELVQVVLLVVLVMLLVWEEELAEEVEAKLRLEDQKDLMALSFFLVREPLLGLDSKVS